MTDNFLRLLEQKVQEAEASLKESLNEQLFGPTKKEGSMETPTQPTASQGNENQVGGPAWSGMTGTTPPWTKDSAMISGVSEFQRGRMPTINVDEIKRHMNTAVSRGAGPDRFVVHPETYKLLQASFEPHARYTDTKLANAGIDNLVFKGTPVTIGEDRMSKDSVYMLGGQATKPPKMGSFSAAFNQTLKDQYIPALRDNIFKEGPLMAALKKGTDMSITKELRAEINHDKEVKRVRKQLKKFEGSWLYKLESGARIGFDCDFGGDKKYSYAAVFDGKCWHLTGRSSSQGISTDDLVDWLIEREVNFGKVNLFVKAKK